MADRVDIGLGTSDQIRGQIIPVGDKGVKAPDHIIKTLASARAVYYKYRAEHVKRISLYAAIEGMIAGNPPYNPAELQRMGLSHIANFNTLDGRALWERGCLAYWNLLNEAETIIKFTINAPEVEARSFEDIMSKEWDTVVRKWPSFETVMGTMSGQLVKFGISPAYWPDERDWRWRTIELPKFFIPDQAQSDLDLLTCVAVESMFTAQYLMEVYEEFKDKKESESPWDMKELSALLLHIANSFAKTSYEFIDFHDLQKRLQNGDIGYDVLFSDSIRIVSLLYKEYDGKISHYMFHRTYDRGDFLYFADRQYKNFSEALSIFTASPGEYTIHSNRGLGHKIYSSIQAKMQLDCSIVDGARWASTPLLKSTATGSRDFEQIRFYPGVPTNIGTAEFQQNTMGANLNQMIGVSQYLLQNLQYNAANAGDDPAQVDKNVGSISPSQARMQSYKEFSVLKNNIAHFYKQFDQVIQTMVVKMLESKKGYPGGDYADEWKTRCLEQGVPEEMFSLAKRTPWGMPRLLSVKASRVAGDGSTLARIMGLQELMPIAGGFGPKAGREYQRQWIMATMGKEYVPAFLQETDDQSGGDSIAGAENGLMRLGESPVFSMNNEHQGHFGTHMALATDTIQMIQQQQTDPVQADKIFTVLIPHLEEHFNAASRSMFLQNFVRSQKKNLDQVVQYATLNKKNAEKMLEAQVKKQQELQAQNQQVLTEEQLKTMQAQGAERRADFKVRSQVTRAQEANANRAEVMKEKVKQDADVKRLAVQLDHQVKSQKAEQDATLEEPLPQLRQKLVDMSGATPAPNDLESVPTI